MIYWWQELTARDHFTWLRSLKSAVMPEQVHFAQASNSRERRRCVLALKTRLVFSIDTMFFSPNYRNCLTSWIFQQVAGMINPKGLESYANNAIWFNTSWNEGAVITVHLSKELRIYALHDTGTMLKSEIYWEHDSFAAFVLVPTSAVYKRALSDLPEPWPETASEDFAFQDVGLFRFSNQSSVIVKRYLTM